ncbi:hypothetical protein P4O66_001238 [Electrophorus voltai]|uniref:Uncharacterized protein n=1 Tax=Electrophorus voltai TaxID=2609070 RepID=A0AAD9DWA3_9TELE|nr:hypothetical protein P4O66_001238 [Electrophorus voltai]
MRPWPSRAALFCTVLGPARVGRPWIKSNNNNKKSLRRRLYWKHDKRVRRSPRFLLRALDCGGRGMAEDKKIPRWKTIIANAQARASPFCPATVMRPALQRSRSQTESNGSVSLGLKTRKKMKVAPIPSQRGTVKCQAETKLTRAGLNGVDDKHPGYAAPCKLYTSPNRVYVEEEKLSFKPVNQTRPGKDIAASDLGNSSAPPVLGSEQTGGPPTETGGQASLKQLPEAPPMETGEQANLKQLPEAPPTETGGQANLKHLPEAPPMETGEQANLKQLPEALPMETGGQANLKQLPEAPPTETGGQASLKQLPEAPPTETGGQANLKQLQEAPPMETGEQANLKQLQEAPPMETDLEVSENVLVSRVHMGGEWKVEVLESGGATSLGAFRPALREAGKLLSSLSPRGLPCWWQLPAWYRVGTRHGRAVFVLCVHSAQRFAFYGRTRKPIIKWKIQSSDRQCVPIAGVHNILLHHLPRGNNLHIIVNAEMRFLSWLEPPAGRDGSLSELVLRAEAEKSPSPILSTFYRDTIESILSSCITTWFGNCTVFDRKTLQRVVRTAEKIIGVSLPSITDIYTTRCICKATSIVGDSSHKHPFAIWKKGPGYRSEMILNKSNKFVQEGSAHTNSSYSIITVVPTQACNHGGQECPSMPYSSPPTKNLQHPPQIPYTRRDLCADIPGPAGIASHPISLLLKALHSSL